MRVLKSLTLLATTALSFPVLAAPADGSDPVKYNLKIDRQSLSTALQEFATQSGIQIIFFAKVTDGHEAPSLEGRYTAADAVARLLDHSDLTFQQLNPKTIEVEPKAATNDLKQTVGSSFVAPSNLTLTQSDSRSPQGSGQQSQSSSGNTQNSQTQSTVSPPSSEGKEQVSELQEIVVTGTLIRGIAPVGTEVTTVDRADIVSTGVVSTQDLLSTMPQITSAFNNINNPNTGVNGTTIVRSNIHNIGAAAGGNTTLIVFDGHDVVGAGILQTTPDAGVLPPGILQSVQVVADGGSALYGADAVGGIINFITRKHMEGVEVDAHYGAATGYHAEDANITGGHEWNSGSFLISYSYRTNTDLTGSDRPYFSQNLVPFGGSDHRSTTCPLTNVTVNGVNYAAPGFVANTQNLCNQDLYNDLYPAETQNSVFAAFNQDISSGVTFDVTGYYTDRKTERLGAQITSTGTITSTNPYFIPVGGATSETVAYSYAAAGGNSFTDQTHISEGGITPELKIKLAGDWDLTTLLNYGRSVTSANSPEINPTADAAALAGTTLATALDPYDTATTNQSVLKSIMQFQQYAINTQNLYEAKAVAQGTVFSLPGGNSKLAVGAQYEYQSISALQLDGPDGTTAGAARANADLRNTSAFGELLLPIVGTSNSLAGVRKLDLDLQGRIDHYDLFGSTTNPKFGLTWKPIDDLTFRATWGTSFVAPSLADISGSVDYRAQVVSTSPFGPGPFNSRPTILLAGGGDVKPMTSKSYTAGFDYNPEWLESTTVSLTYWDTEVDKLISIYPVFSGAYFFNNFPNQFWINPTLAQAQAIIGSERVQGPSLAQLYSNPATTPYAILDAERTNLGSQYLKGLDFNLSFKQPTGFGSIYASAAGTYALSVQSLAVGASTKVSDFTAGNNISRLLFTAQGGATVGRYTAGLTFNYSSGFPVNQPGQTSVGAFYPVNLKGAYDFGNVGGMKDLTVTLNWNNVFNMIPAFENHTGGGTPDGIGNGATVGRFVNLGVHAKF